MSVAASLITGLLGGSITLLTTLLELDDLEQREAKAEELSERQRQDVLSAQREQFGMQQKQFGLQQEQLGFQKREAVLSRKERMQDRTQRSQSELFNNALSIFNQGIGLRDRVAQRWGGR